LLGEGWRLNEGQHALLLCNTLLVWRKWKSGKQALPAV
jgi:hypothetical protein